MSGRGGRNAATLWKVPAGGEVSTVRANPMRQLQLVPALLLAAATSGLAQGGVEQSLRRLEDEWARAVVRRDPAPLRRLLSEDFVATAGRGQLRLVVQLAATRRS